MLQAKHAFYENLEYLKTIDSVHFTAREIDILSCLIHGRSAKKIASLLSITPKTIENHTHNIMAKLGCNSRDGVLDFIERSGKIQLLRQHYTNLLVHELFKKSLRQMSQLNITKQPPSLNISGKGENLKKILLKALELHLKMIGLPLKVQQNRSENITTFSLLLKGNTTQSTETLTLEDENNYYFAFFSILQKLIPFSSVEKIFIDFKEHYEKITKLQEPIHILVQTENKERNTNIWQFRKVNITLISLILGGGLTFFFCSSYLWLVLHPPSGELIHSPLKLPNKRVLLSRPELIAQIERTFQKNKGMHVLALVGMGGAGKTTLARQYAFQKNNEKIVWELNAETFESLLASLEDLAYSLASAQERNGLKTLQEIKDPDKRGKQIVKFVKAHLKVHHHWLLIYDNIRKAEDLNDYFPTDSKMWGEGKVILTTQDSTIGNSPYVNDIIHIGELTENKKIDLFTNILYEHNTPPQNEFVKVKAFLKDIPSFPLDICVAAYYLKFGNISFDDYLNILKKNHKDFENMQKILLKDTGDYSKTRYNIITLSLKKLVDTHKDFEDLLLFISLLDSQKIPRDLLDRHKNRHIVDNFIYHLNKYSLLNNHSNNIALDNIYFHRSTQRIILTYLINTLPIEKQKKALGLIAQSLNTYITAVIEEENHTKMKTLIAHYEALVSHKDYLPASTIASFNSQSGTIYYFFGNYLKSKKYLELSLRSFDNQNSNDLPFQIQSLDYLGIVYKNLEDYEKAKFLLEKSLSLQEKNTIKGGHPERTLSFLGSVYRYLGEYKKAKNALEKSLVLYKKNATENFAGLSRCLSYLGEVYRTLGDYKNAKMALEESETIFKKNPNNPLRHARVLGELGRVYTILGEYDKSLEVLKKSYTLYEQHLSSEHEDTAWAAILLGSTYEAIGCFEKARDLLEKSLAIYKKGATDHSVPLAWVSALLAKTLVQLGLYEEAHSLLQKSLENYKYHLPEDNIEVAHVSFLLARTLIKLGKLEIAKEILLKALESYNKFYGKGHFESGYLLLELGDTYFQKGDLVTAEKYFRTAESLFQAQNHPSLYLAFEQLADFYLKTALLKKDSPQVKEDKNQAINYLNSALKIANDSFPEDSQYIQRIKSKITILSGHIHAFQKIKLFSYQIYQFVIGNGGVALEEDRPPRL